MGLLTCGNCGLDITGVKKKGRYIYYHCGNYRRTCNKKAITEERFEQSLLDLFKEVKMDEKNYELAKEALKQSHQKAKIYREEEIKKLQDELLDIREKLDELYLDKIDKKISEDFWETTSKRWSEKQDKLLQAIEQLKHANINYLNAGIMALRLITSLHENYLTKRQHEKRDTLKLILSKRSIVNANPDISLGLPFSHVAEFVKTGDMLGR